MITQIKMIRDAYQQLVWAFDSCNVNHARELFDMCKADEKSHRGFLPDFNACHTIDTIGVNDAAKLFAVKRVAEYLTPDAKLPELKDYLHTQKSCYYAAAMTLEHLERIHKAWEIFPDITALASLDYCDFVKTRKPELMPA